MAMLSNSSMHDDRCREVTRQRLVRRLYALLVAFVVGITIVYGETWLLEDQSTQAMEYAVTTSVAHAFDAEAGAN